MLDWLVNNVLSNLAATLLIALGGILLTLLKKRSSSWADPAMYGLAGCTLVAVLLFSVKSFSRLETNQPVSVDNVENKLRDWSESLGYSIKKLESDNAYFTWQVTVDPAKTVIRVSRSKKSRSQFLELHVDMKLSQGDRIVIEAHSSVDQNRLVRNLKMRLAGSRIHYGNITLPLGLVHLTKSLLSKLAFGAEG